MGPALRARMRTVIRGGWVALVAIAMLAGAPAPVAATVRGGCEVTGTSTSGGPIDLTTEPVWHVRSTDRISGAGTAPTPQTHATVRATALGFAIPIGGGPADPATAAESDSFEISTFARLGRVFLISGESAGPAGACDGEILIVIDDVNPLVTVLGGGGLIAVLIGLLGLAWGLRKPTGLVRRGVGLVSMVLIGAGGSLVLQQTAPLAGEAANALTRSPFVDSVLSPAQLTLDSMVLVQAGIVTLLLMVLMPFPSQLFNSTLEQNYDRIRAGFRRLPLVSRLVRAPSDAPAAPGAGAWRRRFGVAVFVLVSGLLYGLLDPTFGPNARSLVTYGGIVAAMVIVTWLANLPSRAIHGRLTGDRGRMSVVTSTLVVAAACVLISRVVGFLPGYLYGLVFGYSFAVSIEPRQDGRAGALGAWWLLALAFVAWVTLGAVRIPGVEDTVQGTIAASVLAAVVVAGIEGVVLSLVPLRFLPGELVLRWQRVRWVVLYAVGLFGFVFILLNPASGYVPQQASVPFVVALGLFAGFALASVLFWGWFRFRPRRDTA